MDYIKKRERLLNTTPKQQDIIDIAEVKRSTTPTPEKKINNDTLGCKKIVYKNDLEATKTELLSKHVELADKHTVVSSNVADVTAKLDTLSKNVETLHGKFDISKIDVLKSTLNQSIDKTNTNLTNVANTLVSHADKMAVLESRISNIEAML